MKSWFIYFKKNRDTALLTGALLCLIIALLKPTVPIKHNIYTYLLIADISQSMNTVDTVSYTHLDVYKRQVIARDGWAHFNGIQ